MKRTKKKFSVRLGVMILLFALSVVAFVGMFFQLQIYSRNNQIEKVEQISEDNKRTVISAINTQYSYLDLMALDIGAGEELISDETFEKLNNSLPQSFFNDFTVYNLDGMAYRKGEFIGNDSEQDIFKSTINGFRTVKCVQENKRTKLFQFAVPIKKSGVTSGVLVGDIMYDRMCYTLQSKTNTDFPVLITDSEREVLVTNIADKGDILQLRSLKYHIGSEDIIEEDIKNNQSGNCVVEYENQKYYLSYKRLNINNWYLFNFVPTDKAWSDMIITVEVILFIIAIIYITILSIYIRWLKRTHKKVVNDLNYEISTFITTVPGGVVICSVGDEFTIENISNRFLDIVGVSRESFESEKYRTLNSFIYNDDLEYFNKICKENITLQGGFEYKIRFKNSIDEVIWVNAYSQFIIEGENAFKLYTVIIDMTEEKRIEKELKISRSRYEIIMEQSKNIIFEYNMRTQQYYITENFKQIFNVPNDDTDIFTYLIRNKCIHEDDIPLFNQILDNVYLGKGIKKADIRVRDNSRKYTWYSFDITNITNDRGVPICSVGTIANIQLQKRNISLSIKDENIDTITGCHNRFVTEELIQNFIDTNTEDIHCGFAVISVDNLTYSHQTLSEKCKNDILKNVSVHLKSQVRSADVVGRISNNEFIVFMQYISSRMQIETRMDAILVGAKDVMVSGLDSDISLSIGFCVYPEDGISYESLFNNAYYALSIAKKNGGNQAKMYEK